MHYVLITGVSSGIGYSLTRHLLAHHYFVFGSVRTEADSVRLRQEFGENFRALIFDIRDEAAIQSSRHAVEEVLEGKPLKALINNAGVAVHGPLQYLSTEELQVQFDINVMGTLKVTKVFLDLLGSKLKGGHQPGIIINMSSVSGQTTTPFLTPYCASKYALESIGEGLHRELMPMGIRVISIKPGPVASEIWNKALTDTREYSGTPYEAFFTRREELIRKFTSKTVSTEKLSRLVHRILIRRNPRTSYVITPYPVMTWVQKVLPKSWIDEFYRQAYKRM